MIGLDVGDKRIGVAAADALGLTAQGLPTIVRQGSDADLDKVIDVYTQRQAKGIVVGMPYNMDGSRGPQAEKVKGFADELVARMLERGIDEPAVIYRDERLTTVAATRTLIDADVSRKKRKDSVDKLAAVLILQGYLDMVYYKNKDVQI